MFKSFLKLSELGTSRTWVGSAYHADARACENACSPNLVLSRGRMKTDVGVLFVQSSGCDVAVGCFGSWDAVRVSSAAT